MNFLAREEVGLGQSALYEVYSKEEKRKVDIVDYALLDTMHESRDFRYGKPYKPRNQEPAMSELLTGGYVTQNMEDDYNRVKRPDPGQLTEEEQKEIQDAILRKEIAKSKWMTETRDNFRKFTDDPADVYYIGNRLADDKKLANMAEGHYMTSYKRDFGDAPSEEDEGEVDVEPEPEEEKKDKKEKKSKRSQSPNKKQNRSQSRENVPTKQKKLDIKRWIYERNKAKYGHHVLDKSKLSKKERKELERIEKEISVSRWKPNTHTLSLHGKPIWHPYGQANRDPTVGGVVYGEYMLTHNINPHSGENKPLYQQVYDSAANKAFENGKPKLVATRELPKSPKITKEELEDLKSRNPIMPLNPAKDLKRDVKQLDLMREVCFASKHSTPAQSELVDCDITTEGETKEKVQPAKTTKARPASVKPKKTVKATKATTRKAEPQEVEAGVRLNVKDAQAKDGNRGTRTSNMKTMASTGKFDKTKQPKSPAESVSFGVSEPVREQKIEDEQLERAVEPEV